MNLFILGATGRVGRFILLNALKDKNNVTALVRDPEKLDSFLNDAHLTIVRGNVLNREDIRGAIKNADVVISALNTDGTTTLSESMPQIIEEMQREGIKRIITIGTAGILNSREYVDLLRYASPESRRRSTRAAKEHHKVYDLLKQTNLNWTIVCPTALSEAEAEGEYRTTVDFLPENGRKISIKDTADFAYMQILNHTHIKARVGIAY
ncbi:MULTISPECIES: NAD(P)-dependent oxidoreductase [Shouchella]|uniref:SDR family oxidoreductase n=1 Tax=Shouchella hunanensis TaxID=766894 RepID=A0ABY7WEA3_9BACI|nr:MULTISPECIES: SDR family oxidoreductase [Shouchella]WDF05831.1 SDR family oxidoreductase [Shouchella hunanensis]